MASEVQPNQIGAFFQPLISAWTVVSQLSNESVNEIITQHAETTFLQIYSL